ncbi:MAG: I78 family peptidase inhibitor [Luteimonas sp.]
MARTLLGVFLLLALPLVACAPLPATQPPPSAYSQCVAEPATWALGKAATNDVVERIRVDTHSQTARVLRPDQAVTLEFLGERVNVRVNKRNAITGVSCG